jgi:DNA-binding protein HU-beta
MNKRDLAQHVARQLPCTRREAAALVDAVLDGIRTGLQQDGSVQLSGFGTFEVRRRRERTVPNPRTRQPMRIPARRCVVFRAGDKLRGELPGAVPARPERAFTAHVVPQERRA